ncbi:arabinosyltransferase XEG113-like isoform X1 [Papaver somniferum]|uniref:arabinosyltransferase XEG113-like isoform X1 n=1 Tax=Papaver somniferum TaxID=3469 RepID=UPI000E705DBC|nr:arabinosyltransferase XEG113-like isoform X1 [Papaver somniferum]
MTMPMLPPSLRMWFPHPGIMPGTMTRQPYLCPLDHVFEINIMLKEQSEETFGPKIDIREYSFVDNPLVVPKQVKESWFDVQQCQEGSPNCHAVTNTSRPGTFRFPKNRNEETCIWVFSSFKDVKALQFSSLQDAFSGFSDKAMEETFRNRLEASPTRPYIL